MRRWMDGLRRLGLLRRRAGLERGLDEEIRFHIDRQTEKHIRAGMVPDEARRQALLRFGGVERARESTRDELRLGTIEDYIRDFRYGWRALRRAPGFTTVATLTLALGIGATTAMFSIVNGVLLRPLPYPEQDRLIEVVHEAPGLGIQELFASPAIYFGYRDHSRTFESVGLWDWDSSPATVSGSGEPQSVPSVEVTHEVLRILGADPILGRTFTADDDRPGSAPTVILSYGYWQRRFGGASPLGQALVVDGIPREVIGVLPQSFRFFEYPAEVVYPLQLERSDATFPSFDGRAIARLRPGITLLDANADVARMIPILMEEFGQPGARWEQAQFGPKLRWLKQSVVGEMSDTLWLLMGTIGLLLLIACANVSNLVLVRTQSRRPELVIRTALGAGWAAVARVIVIESALLGLAGGVAGVAVAYTTLPLLLSLGAADLPDIMAVTIDPTVVLVALATSILATVLFALVPVFQLGMRKLGVADALRGGRRSITEGQEGTRARQLLVVAQVAIALVLLVGCGLMVRSFTMLRQVDPGFREPGTILTFQLTIRTTPEDAADRSGAPTPQQALRARQAIVERLAAVPGVEAAAFSAFNDGLPLDGDNRSSFVLAENAPEAGRSREIQFASPGFFETMRTPLVAGRSFEWDDVYQQRPVVLVSENVARTEWGSAGAALGKRMGRDRSGPWFEVVGVVQDVHHNGLSQPAPETVIFPAVPSETASFVIRSARVGAIGFLEEVRRAVWSVNPNLSLAGVQTLGDLYERAMARTAMTLQLLAITGTIAVVLGLIGVYGIVSYAMSQRRREIGIRLALGAEHGEVRWMFVRKALTLVGIGVAIGLGAAAGLTGLMESQLFGVSRLDPPTHVAIALGLVTAAAVASYASAWRASALDPIEVLKAE